MQSPDHRPFYDRSFTHWTGEYTAAPAKCFRIPVGEALRAVYPDIFTLWLRGNPTVPTTFVELGAGTQPMTADIISALRNDHQTTRRPHVLLYDFAYYNNPVTAALTAARFLPNRNQINQANIPTRNPHWQAAVRETVARHLDLTLSSTGIPNLRLPDQIPAYHLVFICLANYVSQTDLFQALSDPRIRSVTFANDIMGGVRRGYGKHFHPERASRSQDISRFLGRTGFLPLLTIATDKTILSDHIYQHGEGGLAGAYVRPQNHQEARWIADHAERHLVNIDQFFEWEANLVGDADPDIDRLEYWCHRI